MVVLALDVLVAPKALTRVLLVGVDIADRDVSIGVDLLCILVLHFIDIGHSFIQFEDLKLASPWILRCCMRQLILP